ncbi:lipopolysaccharide biosynthesis protein [Hydrogenophaga sp. PBL-H3]|uniref:lipopolysaccharide biosynthesis protein n=1 Tax=Hydrogenophaga sp. PBL-H3 TaxID=434010 RepID=UPI00131F65C0|nr:hypothetical protein [Hydrogenophaga sp. PBL-H3]QHE78140.1 hypothetical protein F9Z45_19935 [Hydrogenophaga sp. PBL-H3]QHE82565.1 hypothetical protein F9Z44_19935 [Hydrogenophaga sp. PBL-H3]
MNLRAPLGRFLKASAPLRSVAGRNATSSFLALAWLSLLSVLSIPIYIQMLGLVEWGLVAACVSLQVLSNFLDAGFSQIVPRWAAKEAHKPSALMHHVALFRRMYWILGLSMFILLQVAAGYLANNWFLVPLERAHDLEIAIRITSLQMLFQFVNNMHIGLWHGLQKQVLANLRVCSFGTIKHVSTMLAMYISAPHVWLYASVFAFWALIEMVTNAVTVRRMMGTSDLQHYAPLRPLLREVTILSGGILVGLLVIQLDRIILSRTVPVEAFGVYTVVAAMAMAFLQLQTPLTRAYFPLLVQDIESTGRVSPARMKRLIAGTVLISTIPALLACLLAAPLLELWLRNPGVVDTGARPLQLLLLAVAVNSLYGCIYQVILAAGQPQRILQFNLVSLAVAGLVIMIMGTSSGLLLGGAIWLSTTLTQFALGVLWFALHERGTPSIPTRD